MMTKSDTIDAIRHLNPSADPVFLAEFSGEDLASYLDRLAHPPTRGRVFSADVVIDRREACADDADRGEKTSPM